MKLSESVIIPQKGKRVVYIGEMPPMIPFERPIEEEPKQRGEDGTMTHNVRYIPTDPDSKRYKVTLPLSTNGTVEGWIKFHNKLTEIHKGNWIMEGTSLFEMTQTNHQGESLRVWLAKSTELKTHMVEHHQVCV